MSGAEGDKDLVPEEPQVQYQRTYLQSSRKAREAWANGHYAAAMYHSKTARLAGAALALWAISLAIEG